MRAPRTVETAVFVVSTCVLAWPLLALSTHGGDFEMLAGIAMCIPGAMGLALGWGMRREGPSAARIGVGAIAAWPLAFVSPPLLTAAVALMASRLGAFAIASDFRINLPYVGSAVGSRVLTKAALFLLLVHGTYLLPAIVEQRIGRLRASARGAVRVASWVVPMWLAHIAGDFGEELGWRGYLVRRWEDKPRVAVLISSLSWSVFHLPWALDVARVAGGPKAILFLGGIALLGVPMAALYRVGRSVWSCAIAHGGLNLWAGIVLGSSVEPSLPGYSHVRGGEFGAIGVAVLALLAVLTWRTASRAAVARVPTDVGAKVPSYSGTPFPRD
jgi:membrane protease YdiL (CAAX protease family)